MGVRHALAFPNQAGEGKGGRVRLWRGAAEGILRWNALRAPCVNAAGWTAQAGAQSTVPGLCRLSLLLSAPLPSRSCCFSPKLLGQPDCQLCSAVIQSHVTTTLGSLEDPGLGGSPPGSGPAHQSRGSSVMLHKFPDLSGFSFHIGKMGIKITVLTLSSCHKD